MEIPASVIVSGPYTYVVVKASVHASDTAVFGLSAKEIAALQKKYPGSGAQIINGIRINSPPVTILNTLAEIGYRVIASSGETEVTWTLQREGVA